MSNAIQILHNILSLQETAPNTYLGQSHNPGWNRVYGGQVIAQAIMAVTKTARKDVTCHSMHGYFMRPGNPQKPIDYKIDPIHDGRSFQTRMVYANQEQETIFVMGASFHKTEQGLEHQDDMGSVPKPDDLPSIEQLITDDKDQFPPEVTAYFQSKRPFQMRPLDVTRYITPTPKEPKQAFWIKTTAPLKDNLALHQAALGYASDFTLLDTALIAHGKLLFDPSLMMASLDHAIWFHRPFRIDDWLLYRQTSSNAFGARALCHGQFFDQKGTLVASTTQEGLTRSITK